MNKIVTQTIELTPDDIKLVLTQAFAKQFGGRDIDIVFTVGDTSDDRYRHSPSYSLTGARITGKTTIDL